MFLLRTKPHQKSHLGTHVKKTFFIFKVLDVSLQYMRFVYLFGSLQKLSSPLNNYQSCLT